MAERFVNLSCANCGAKLDVYDDMERFACGYCGTEMTVQRRGGTVALKAVTEAIRQVQIGTDKMAAELALVRLGQDLVRLNEDIKKLVAEAEGLKAASFTNRGCATFFAGIIGLLGIIALIDIEGRGPGFEIGFLMVAGSLVWFVKTWAISTANKVEVRAIQEQIAAKRTKIEDVKHRIAEQRLIVDAVQ